MDEHTLNDLLECSVCLERLDTSSKVLPCQHTFCRKCLEVIISSHQELRCPECRVLVDIKIDDLPPNVLLMRILEGMRNAATTKTQQKQINSRNIETDRLSIINGNHQSNANNHEQMKEKSQQLQQFILLKKTQIQQDQQNHHHQQQQQPRRSLLPHAYAIHDFESTESSDLSFKKGDLVLLKRKIDDNWCVGQANGVEGTFPINYVKVIVPLPSPQCIALYDFKMGPNEEEGCLSFKKGDIIHVFRRVDHNWAEGRIGGTIGIFPIAFVRLNALAEQMLDVNQRQPLQQINMVTSTTTIPTPTASTSVPCSTATNTITTNSSISNTNSLATSSNDSCPSSTPSQSQENTPLHLTKTNTMPSRRSSTEETSTNSDDLIMLGASGVDVVQLRYREGREKRHSLNALLNDTASNNTAANELTREANRNNPRSILHSNRHSAEILSLPHELTTDAQTTSQVHNSALAMPQTTMAHEQQQQARVNVLKTPVIVQQQMIPPSLPWGYLALYPYKPRKSDELELKKGCVYIVTERCLDGWFKGKNWQDTLGVFPGNYVTPLRPRDQKQLMHQWKHVPLVSMAPMSNITTTSAITTLATTTNRNNLAILQIPPPDAPPRQVATVSPSSSPSASTTTCASVWTKPLGHTVEAFFSRNSSGSNNQKNADKNKDKENMALPSTPSTSNSSSSSANAAVSLMKRLTNMKSRSKSPAAHLVSQNESNLTTTTNARNVQTQLSTIKPQQQQQTQQAHAIHVRSGSCPSQLLQNMPKQQQQQQQQNMLHEQQQNHAQQQVASGSSIHFGSQRLKGCKERPILPNARQSLDANMFRSAYQQHSSSVQHQQQQQQQQQQQVQYNLLAQNTSQTLQTINHRKSQSLDANTVLMGTSYNTGSNPLPPPMPATTYNSTHTNFAGRFRCIVPYPPNSEFELELHVDDIIFVNRKPKNGWLKGTCVRTNKTGLFPASFVEPICLQK